MPLFTPHISLGLGYPTFPLPSKLPPSPPSKFLSVLQNPALLSPISETFLIPPPPPQHTEISTVNYAFPWVPSAPGRTALSIFVPRPWNIVEGQYMFLYSRFRVCFVSGLSCDSSLYSGSLTDGGVLPCPIPPEQPGT